jgi:hypothetical protein
LTIKGRKQTVKPKTKPIFAIFEPTTFPMAIAGLPSRVACILTKSSGADVPNETIVTPINNGEILNLLAIPIALFTKKSPPTTSRTRPIMSNTYSI